MSIPRPAPRAPRLALFASFAALYVFWGGTFLAIRYAVAEIPPLLMMAARCGAGAAILAAWLAWRGKLERPTRAQWATSALAGAFLFVGCHGLLAWAEQRVSSGQAALYATAIPLWIVLLDALGVRRAPARRVLAGLGLGTLGVAVLTGGGGGAEGTAVDRVVLIVSALFWAAGSLVARDGARPVSAAQSTAMQLAAGAAALLAASALTGELSRGWSPAAITIRGAAALAFLVVCGTVLGFGAYTWLMRVATPAAASSYAFVNPVIALLLGWAAGDEAMTARTAIAATLVVGSVLLTRSGPPVQDSRSKAAPKARPAAAPSNLRIADS